MSESFTLKRKEAPHTDSDNRRFKKTSQFKKGEPDAGEEVSVVGTVAETDGNNTKPNWPSSEKKKFLVLLKKYGKDWFRIAQELFNKKKDQVRRYFENYGNKAELEKILAEHAAGLEQSSSSKAKICPPESMARIEACVSENSAGGSITGNNAEISSQIQPEAAPAEQPNLHMKILPSPCVAGAVSSRTPSSTTNETGKDTRGIGQSTSSATPVVAEAPPAISTYFMIGACTHKRSTLVDPITKVTWTVPGGVPARVEGDMKDLTKSLVEVGACNTVTLCGAEATSTRLLQEVGSSLRGTPNGKKFVLFLLGHGSLKGIFCTADYRKNAKGETLGGLRGEDLRDLFGEAMGRQIDIVLIVLCCCSQLFCSNLTPATLPLVAEVGRIITIASCLAGEIYYHFWDRVLKCVIFSRMNNGVLSIFANAQGIVTAGSRIEGIQIEQEAKNRKICDFADKVIPAADFNKKQIEKPLKERMHHLWFGGTVAGEPLNSITLWSVKEGEPSVPLFVTASPAEVEKLMQGHLQDIYTDLRASVAKSTV